MTTYLVGPKFQDFAAVNWALLIPDSTVRARTLVKHELLSNPATDAASPHIFNRIYGVADSGALVQRVPSLPRLNAGPTPDSATPSTSMSFSTMTSITTGTKTTFVLGLVLVPVTAQKLESWRSRR